MAQTDLTKAGIGVIVRVFAPHLNTLMQRCDSLEQRFDALEQQLSQQKSAGVCWRGVWRAGDTYREGRDR